jgi:hypothetical protein
MLKRIYYYIKPFIPRSIQITLRRNLAYRQLKSNEDIWRIKADAGTAPENWTGWPQGHRFAVVLTHDVEGYRGVDRCISVGDLEKSLGFRSSFNFVCEDYTVRPEVMAYLKNNGFEVGVHGLTHKGNLFRSKKVFSLQTPKINTYLQKWGAVGFRSPSMYHRLDWVGDLNINYDASTFDTDPFEPQPDGMGTIFPFWVEGSVAKKGFVELPYTLPQDSTLFVIMGKNNIDIWKRKIDWIAERGGMVLLITHPDYMRVDGEKPSLNSYPMDYYKDLLEYLRNEYSGLYWHALPKDVAHFWSSRSHAGM